MPCTKDIRFSNSLKIILIYVSVMLLAIAEDLVTDILTLAEGYTFHDPIVSRLIYCSMNEG